MEPCIKNMPYAKVLALAAQTECLDGQIVSKTLAQSKYHSLTLFTFDKGEEISSHDSEGDAFVMVLDGQGRITIDDKEHILRPGEAIIMPAKIPHAVYAKERFKMLLLVLFPETR